MSIGICTLVPDSLQTPHEVLIHGADEALYTAKLRGRNLAVANTYGGLVSIAASVTEHKRLPDGRSLAVEGQWETPSQAQDRDSEVKKLESLLLIKKELLSAKFAR